MKIESTFNNNSGGANTLRLLLRQHQNGNGTITIKTSSQVSVAAGDSFTITYTPSMCTAPGYEYFTRADFADGTSLISPDEASCSG